MDINIRNFEQWNITWQFKNVHVNFMWLNNFIMKKGGATATELLMGNANFLSKVSTGDMCGALPWLMSSHKTALIYCLLFIPELVSFLFSYSFLQMFYKLPNNKKLFNTLLQFLYCKFISYS